MTTCGLLYWWSLFPLTNYRPQTKLREGYVFTGVCDSVNGGVGIPSCLAPPLYKQLQLVVGLSWWGDSIQVTSNAWWDRSHGTPPLGMENPPWDGGTPPGWITLLDGGTPPRWRNPPWDGEPPCDGEPPLGWRTLPRMENPQWRTPLGWRTPPGWKTPLPPLPPPPEHRKSTF